MDPLPPHLLHYVQGRAYLVAHCHKAQDRRQFAVQRILSAVILDDPFEPDETFDAHAYVTRSFGVFQGPVHRMTVDFDPDVAHHARERTWHASQHVTDLDGGWVRLTFEAAGLPEVAAWIAGYGGKARAVGPAELVEAVQRLHREGLEACQGRTPEVRYARE